MTTPKSEFVVEVVRVGEITKHPNADKLSLTTINGYPVIIQTGAFVTGDLAVYVPVDCLVPTKLPQFNFLWKPDREFHRVKAVRLRGIFSMGLLVPPPPGVTVGQDVAEILGVQRWIPPSERKLLTQSPRAAMTRSTSDGFRRMPTYGLDPMRKYGHVLQPGEQVVITEKIHGCNSRYIYHGGRLHVGSHHSYRGSTTGLLGRACEWLATGVRNLLGLPHAGRPIREFDDVWWEIARRYDLEKLLSQFPGMVVYGEIYGQGVQDLTYDAPQTRKLAVFDVYDSNHDRWLEYDEAVALTMELGLPMVPLLYRGPWDEACKVHAVGPTVLGGRHIREGIVVKPVPERTHPHCGRVAQKYVSEDYLLRKDAE